MKNIPRCKMKEDIISKRMEVAIFVKCSGNNIQLSVSRAYRVPRKDKNEKVG